LAENARIESRFNACKQINEDLRGSAQGTFEWRPSAEAKDGDVLVAEHAAVSQLRPIQDGPDNLGEHWGSATTASGGRAPGEVPEMFDPAWEGLYTKTSVVAS
jgi:hypothetical protein